MLFFKGDLSAPAIVMDNARETGQSFTVKPLEKKPEGYDSAYELNPNHVGFMIHGARIVFKDARGMFWQIIVERLPMAEIHRIEDERSKLHNMGVKL